MYMTTTHHYCTKFIGMKNHKMTYSIIYYIILTKHRFCILLLLSLWYFHNLLWWKKAIHEILRIQNWYPDISAALSHSPPLTYSPFPLTAHNYIYIIYNTCPSNRIDATSDVLFSFRLSRGSRGVSIIISTFSCMRIMQVAGIRNVINNSYNCYCNTLTSGPSRDRIRINIVIVMIIVIIIIIIIVLLLLQTNTTATTNHWYYAIRADDWFYSNYNYIYYVILFKFWTTSPLLSTVLSYFYKLHRRTRMNCLDLSASPPSLPARVNPPLALY